MDGAAHELYLPEPMIQVVQSFLTSKQAARSTVFSKTWRGAWLTRQNLDFERADFFRSLSRKLDPKFLTFVEKTLEKYENSNLGIDSFRLSMKHPSFKATKLIHRALKLGPTRLTFEFGDSYGDFDIPDDVFRCEYLVSLTAKGCRINPNPNEVCCSRLQLLSLEYVMIKSLDTMFHIISSFPLIEKLSLCNVKVDHRYGAESVVGPIIISPLHRLKSLVLKYLNFYTLFLAHLSSNFPSLKDLTLHKSRGQEEILISSPTLERMYFSMENDLEYNCTIQVVKLDVPSIRKLTFACDELSITSNSKGWESCVSVMRGKCLDASCFNTLSNFIDKFKLSRISLLSLHVCIIGIFIHEEAGDIRGLSTPETENLTIYVRDSEFMKTRNCYALFNGLFKMCHPKVINIRSVSTYGTKIINFLAKRLLDALDVKVPTPNQCNLLMHCLNEYIKEARAQVFDGAVSTWRDVTLDSLLDKKSTTVRTYRAFRFQLSWKE